MGLIKNQATTNLINTPRNIFIDNIGDLTDEQRSALPEYTLIQRAILRERYVPERRLVDAPNLIYINITSIYSTDVRGNAFLLYDSRDEEPDEVVFLIFATEFRIQRLKKYHLLSGDGIFKGISYNFLQLHRLCVLVKESAIPSVYILMANKATETYKRVFQAIRNHVTPNDPISIMLDFEAAPKTSILYLWPGVSVRLCIFHLGQSLMRKVQKEHLLTTYEEDDDFRKTIRSLAGLAFLPERLIPRAFDAIKREANAIANPILEYFKKGI